MAEWLLVIFVMVVLAATYFGTLAVYGEWQVIMPWLVAAVLIAISVGVYISAKTRSAGSKIQEVYNVDEFTP